ncbi:response regulator transcription factor [Dyadobacter tibetensis]|uniref:response regulator transcription factor n=1 Tax=Dyadobacter tibetensis TaxID=1211851 RepID=UPI0004722CD0|nr:response regulator transcription factor [Dyadobacter tibetensis]
MTSNNNSIAVIFDDHQMFAETLSALLERLGIFSICKYFTEEKALLSFFLKEGETHQLFFFVDYYLQDKHTLPIINDARRLNKNIFIIVVSSVTDPLSIQNILSLKPDGFLSKSSGVSEILECIRILEGKEQYISPLIKEYIQDTDAQVSSTFTVREIEMLIYFNQGYSIAETAEKAHLSKHTIVAHRRRMMEKSGCKSIGELLAYARKRAII